MRSAPQGNTDGFRQPYGSVPGSFPPPQGTFEAMRSLQQMSTGYGQPPPTMGGGMGAGGMPPPSMGGGHSYGGYNGQYYGQGQNQQQAFGGGNYGCGGNQPIGQFGQSYYPGAGYGQAYGQGYGAQAGYAPGGFYGHGAHDATALALQQQQQMQAAMQYQAYMAGQKPKRKNICC
eukprot:TRINITY_DN7177_c0_g1_i2.p2 TRINITY_DN7177_c0_g1~~TRINITY_DN7177_c0_g1_i2.p2  ORF type:complete len:175 (+),score=29.86 TRINITY_DN7177_c0_g1_i2:120-644(+)